MRVSLVGAGRIGRLHARLMSGTPGVFGLTIADADEDRAATVAAEVGAATARSIPEALDVADAVVIAASTDAHAGLVRAAMARGLPIFCEKPLAQDLADTRALAGEIERSEVPFQLGFQRRFDAGYREARRLVAAGELGTIYSVRLAGHDPAPPPESYIATSGGLFRDLTIHDFDILRWLTGLEVEEVYADGAVRASPVFERYGDIDTAVVTVRMTGGALGVVTAARHDPLGYDVRAEIFGSKDSIAVGLGPRMPLRSVEPGVPPPPGPLWPDFLVRFEHAYRAELAEFVRVARGEVASPCTAHDGLQALRIAEAATCAVRDHRPVALTEIPS
jgi:myo-inositol 2-dehydrogenase / D-chiro-inositol 1-dehydrogenase